MERQTPKCITTTEQGHERSFRVRFVQQTSPCKGCNPSDLVIPSPGDQISIVDLHLGPWLARVAYLAGAEPNESGDTVIAKIEARVGADFALPKSFQTVVVPKDPAAAAADEGAAALQVAPGAKRVKLAAFWDEMKIRPSWKKVYGEKLH